MKKTRRVLLVTVFLISTCLSVNMNTVMAKENTSSVSEEASYDLDSAGVQNFTIVNKNNGMAYITIEKISGEERIANGTYAITYTSPGAWKAGYRVKVSGNRITDAHSPYYTVLTGEVRQTNFAKESMTKVSYYLVYYNGLIAVQTGVRTTIVGTSLKVSQI